MLINQNQAQPWRKTLWREWRNCGNQAYAKQLFELVADSPVGWGTKSLYVLLDAIIGLVVAFLVGFIWTTNWQVLQQLAWAGATIGAVRGVLAVQRLFWRDWLTRLAFGLPAQQPSSGLLAILGLLLLGSVIFGPFLWLFLIGLFWGMSGLIKWMMEGLVAANPFEYHAWYFWWRGRPPIAEVEAALQEAAEAGIETNSAPPGPAGKLTTSLADPEIEIDFLQLKNFARNREVPGA